MNRQIARLIGWQPSKTEAAPSWLGTRLVPLAEGFIRQQPERLDVNTLRVESSSGSKVNFAIDGYAADHESTRVFNTTVRGSYDVTTGELNRLE
jgi:hypothetical protein